MFGFDDILIGAGIGALGSALFGGNPLQGAALGGVGGGLLGGLPAGAWGGGQATALGTSIPTTAAGFEASMGLPSTAFIESGGGLGTALAGRTASMGLAPTVGGTFVNPEYSGLINSGSSMWDKISPYANVQNLSGAANIYNQFNKPTPRPQAQSSGLKQAQIPQGTDVMELLKAIKIPEKKHITLL